MIPKDWFTVYEQYLSGRKGSPPTLSRRAASPNQARLRSRMGGHTRAFTGPLVPVPDSTLDYWKAAYAARN